MNRAGVASDGDKAGFFADVAIATLVMGLMTVSKIGDTGPSVDLEVEMNKQIRFRI